MCTLLILFMQTFDLPEVMESLNASACGRTVGCYWVPSDCNMSPINCSFILMWQYDTKDSVRFSLIAQLKHDDHWVAFGLNDRQRMVLTL